MQRAFLTFASGSRVSILTSWPSQKSCGEKKRFPQFHTRKHPTKTTRPPPSQHLREPHGRSRHPLDYTLDDLSDHISPIAAHPRPVHWICLSFLHLFAHTVSVTKICLNQICRSVQIQYYTSQVATGSKMRFSMPSRKPSGKVSRLSFVK